MSEETVTVIDNRTGKRVELPIRKATQGPDAVDIGSFYRETGYFTYDPGFLSTASCHSQLTYLDGDKGKLMYRGYPIDQLAEKSNFLEVPISCCMANCRNSNSLRSFAASSFITPC